MTNIRPIIRIVEAPVEFESAAAAEGYGCIPTHHVIDAQFPDDNGPFAEQDGPVGPLQAHYTADGRPYMTNAKGDSDHIFAFGMSYEDALANFQAMQW
jgi:hypothetical protein